MWGVSQDFLDTLARSHTQLAYVDVLHNGETVATLKDGRLLDPVTGQVANLIGGSIPVDKTTIRRSGTINFTDVSGQLTPTDVSDLFAPFGTELRVWSGVRYWDAPRPAVNIAPFNMLSADDADFERSLGSWGLVSNVSTLSRVSTQALTGSYSMEIKSLAGGDMSGRNLATDASVVVGSIYTGALYFRAAASPRQVQASIAWIDSGGNVLSFSTGTAVTDSITGWTYAFVTAAAPANAVTATIRFIVQATGAANEIHYVDNLTLHVGSTDTLLAVPQQQEEYAPVGTLVITDVVGTYPQLSFTVYDRMWLLGTFAQPYKIARGTDIITALSGLLATNIPSSRLDLNLPATSEHSTGALLYDVEASVADAAHQIATAGGLQLFVNQMGAFTATAEPSTDDPAVLSYEPGQFSMMMRPARSITGSEAYNAVVFTGEATDVAPVRGYAQDDDPKSLTYVGRMGTRIYYASSPVIRTSAQASLAAKTTLQRILGLADQIKIAVLPNPALDSGDVLALRDDMAGINGNVIADSFTTNLRASDGLMEITCRNQVIR